MGFDDAEARRIVLARRARFIALAAAGATALGLGACETAPAQTCLVAPLDAGSDATDASQDAEDAAEAS